MYISVFTSQLIWLTQGDDPLMQFKLLQCCKVDEIPMSVTFELPTKQPYICNGPSVWQSYYFHENESSARVHKSFTTLAVCKYGTLSCLTSIPWWPTDSIDFFNRVWGEGRGIGRKNSILREQVTHFLIALYVWPSYAIESDIDWYHLVGVVFLSLN